MNQPSITDMEENRLKLSEENKLYIESHPEIRSLLDEFLACVIREKPSDIVNFGYNFFGTLKAQSGNGPCPIVFAGPSGVGKGTLIKMLMDKYPDNFGFSVSHTTRSPRPGEVDGVHYNFVSKPDIESGIEKDEFIEHAYVHTNVYGTSYKAVQKVRK
jgi:guanylate kinase